MSPYMKYLRFFQRMTKGTLWDEVDGSAPYVISFEAIYIDIRMLI